MAPDVAFTLLRNAIVTGQLQPNERLVEAELGDTFGLSRAAVRTALALLEQEGLVAREAHRGAKVRLISTDEAIEILEAREALEGIAARHAAVNASDSDIAELHRITNEMRLLLDKGDLLGLSDESDVLHDRLLDIAHHQTIARLISMLRSQTVRFQFRTILVPGRPDAAFREHSAIVASIAAHDPESAELRMREHVSHIREAIQHGRIAQ